MFKLAEKFFLAGLGALAVTREKLEQIVDELAEKGQVSREEARKMLNDLVDKGEREKDHITNTLRRELNGLRDDLGLVTRSEVEELRKRIAHLEEQLKQRENHSTPPESSMI
ncbi:hypothetical protein GFC01_01540 [Desulfofundulus thermobenzoicus]|uniref:Polyhydroxyalkanoate synthesis regulator n=1 Tax=Desulfofundulus thermobenzoicus TaxID=29376 RepID=A0A6N7IM25_9FIRM|nr:hypothetical protein [Desulfofundulus thermobenzoicus]MQL50974.1 hypothetical protein [Desulfofundulus thermobenzoicus]HHW43490.1 hypothetical protein [Desulfotomaculum sp.]